jgi:c-di-AMP phosphodiesterase-like protein
MVRKLLKNNIIFTIVFFVVELLAYTALGVCYYYFNIILDDVLIYLLFGISGAFVLAQFVVNLIYEIRIRKIRKNGRELATITIKAQTDTAFTYGGVGVVLCDDSGEIIWANNLLNDRVGNLLDNNICAVFPKLDVFKKDPKLRTAEISSGKYYYAVSYKPEERMYLFKDITDLKHTQDDLDDAQPVVGYISLDNYSDVQGNCSDDAAFTDMLSKVRSTVQAYADSYNSIVTRIRDDRYILISTQSRYEKMQKDNFRLCDDVKNLFEKNGFTLSMGIAYGSSDLKQLEPLASNALDTALSRGGDQTVIAPVGKQYLYFGGNAHFLPSKNKIKIRTLSAGLISLFKSYKTILIMPPTGCTMDGLGASFGLRALASFAGVDSYICWDSKTCSPRSRLAVESVFTPEETKKIFVAKADMDKMNAKDTLLVYIDLSDPIKAMIIGADSKFHKFAVIDHHRPGDHYFVGQVFSGIDPSISSTSEIIASYIYYNSDIIEIDSRTATFLLAGICYATDYFKRDTNEGTFEAAKQLRRDRADEAKVYDFMKENLEDYQEKIDIMTHAETPYYGTMVIPIPSAHLVSSDTLEVVVNEAVNVRGISCAFGIGHISQDDYEILAESDGTVDTLKIMDRMGGHGKEDRSLAHFNNTDTDSLKKKLYFILNDYLDDAKMKK